MKRNYTIALIALVGSALAGTSVAQVGGIDKGLSSRTATSLAQSPVTLPLGTSRQQSNASVGAQSSVAAVAPTPSTEISTAHLSGSPAPPSIIVTKDTPLAAAVGARFVVRGANPACTGVRADADVCTGWE